MCFLGALIHSSSPIFRSSKLSIHVQVVPCSRDWWLAFGASPSCRNLAGFMIIFEISVLKYGESCICLGLYRYLPDQDKTTSAAVREEAARGPRPDQDETQAVEDDL